MDNTLDEATEKINGIDLKEENEADEDDPGDEARDRFNKLVCQAKKYVGEGRIEEAVQLNKKALKIFYHEKLAKRIKKMEEYLKAHIDDSDDDEEDDSGMTHLGKGFYLYKELYRKLYSHQQEGVLWLWSLFRRKKGGILGDDMGLGKTIQVIGFLSGMFDMQKIRSVLIILPVALMVNWEKETEKWAPGLKVVAYHGTSKREKERALARVQKRGGICLTTYGLVVTSFEQLGTQDGREFVWDYMILDEGHKIKNPTKTSKGVHAIPANNRIILTGTPVQNNLKELWALFDFVHQGSLLGTQRTFKMEYDTPITRAREKDATVGEKKLGMEMAESLKKIIAPYFLRRTKEEVKEREQNDKKKEKDPKQAEHAVMPTMTRKNDLIVWTFLTDTQLKIYQDFLSLDSVKELLMTTKSPLVALNVLKKICDHPRLLSTKACVQLGFDGDEGLDEDILETEAGLLSAVTRIQHVDDNILINEGGKLLFLVRLLDRLKEEGHRCLVFSQSRKMLDIMQKVLTNRGHKIMRLDGTIAQVQEREQRINKFQTDDSYSVFLLTTQVGGVGLTLTAADRVVIYDPSWNPATDAQAVDRAFRIGQVKNVVIYRLITCGTVEEKIYRRQVFKNSITQQTTGAAKNPYSWFEDQAVIPPDLVQNSEGRDPLPTGVQKSITQQTTDDHVPFNPPAFMTMSRLIPQHSYFSKYELKELFTMGDPHISTTQQQLEQMHGGQRCTDTHLDEHLAFLYSLDMFGISDHDLMFSQGSQGGDDQDNDEDDQSPEDDYIQHRVQKAQELLQMESSQQTTHEERLGKGQPTGGGGSYGGGGPRNWDFPKPEPQLDTSPVNHEDDVSPQPTKMPPPRPIQVDLTSPKHNTTQSEDGSETDASYSVHDDSGSVQDESMDHSTDSPKVKEEFVDLTTPSRHTPNPLVLPKTTKHEPMDLTSSPYNIKAEPNSSVHEKGEPSDVPHMKREPMDLTSTPYGNNLPTATSGSNGKNISTRLFGLAETPDVLDQSKVMDVSKGSSNFVEASPDMSIMKSFHSNRTSSKSDASMNESVAGDGVLEESVSIINDSIVSDNEVEKSGGHGNISVQDIKSILEKSLCSNAEEFNKSHASSLHSLHDSPVTRKTKRRSVCVRRVIESSDEEEDDADADAGLTNDVNEVGVDEHDLPEIDNDSEHEKTEQEMEEGNLEESSHKDIPQDNIDLDKTEDGSDDMDGEDEEVNDHSEIEQDDNEQVFDNTGDINDECEEDSISEGEEKESNKTGDIDGQFEEEKESNNTRDIDDENFDQEKECNNTRDINGDFEEEDKILEEESNKPGGVNGEHEKEEASEEEEEETDGEEEEEDVAEFDSLPEEDQIRYNELVEAGRLYCSSRQYGEAQVCVLQALEIFPDEELQATSVSIQKKILKHQQKAQLQQQRTQELIG